MNKISILGCGWLGKSLAISLINRGYSVKGSTTSEEKLELLEMNNIEPYLVDISDFEADDSFLNSDILIVAITSKDINGFERLIAQIEESPIQKVIFISSTSVYDKLNKVVTEEDAVLEDNPLVKIENLIREKYIIRNNNYSFCGFVW